MANPPTRSPDSGVHEPVQGDTITERDLTDLHEDILDENEENVRQLLREIAEDGLSVEQLCHTELQVEPLSEDHPLNREALSALHRAALLDSNNILTLLLTAANSIDANLPLKASGYTPLHVASLAGIPAAASYLAFNGAKVNVKDHKGQTPIHLCAKNGHADIAKVLAVKGGHIECVDSRKRTPLHYACKEGQLKFVHFLLKKNVALDVVDDKGWTPLHCAVSRGNNEVAEVLLSNCLRLLNIQDHQGNTALHVILSNADRRKKNVLCGNFDTCLCLLLGANGVDCKKRNMREETPLHYSVEYGYNKATNELLSKGVDVNALDVNQESPIFRCCSLEVLKVLLEEPGINIKHHNYAGETVLHCCAKVESMSHEMMSELLSHGAEIDACNSQNETALFLACVQGFTSKVELLLEQGANCEILDCAGQSILHAAIENGHSALAKKLVTGVHVNVDVQNKKGQTALHMAILFKADSSLISILADKTTKLSLPDEYGLFPADYAVRKCDEGISRLLLRKGAEVLRTNSTFLLTFAKNEDLEIVKHLQSLGFNTGLRDNQGRSMLHLAILNQAWHLVDHLIQTNARCDLTDNAGNTPLHHAALTCRSTHLIDELVTNSTSINKRNSEGLSPLHNAALNDYVDILEMLLQLGAKVDAQDKQMRTAFHICGESLVNTRGIDQELAEQKIEVFLDHIESGDPEIHCTSSNGRQIVHYVCEAGNKALAQMCIQKGCKLDKADECGMTPLHYACGAGSPSVITLLLNHEAPIEALDFQGQTPLYQAVSSGQEEAVELLLGHGANVNHQRLPDQATALHIALQQNKRKLSEVLFMHDPDVNLLNSDGQCTLHLASQFGNRELVKACFELRPNRRQKDHQGREAVHYAVYNNDVKVLSLLLSTGCPVDPVDQDNNTPLLLSSKEGSYEHMSVLVESQSNVNHQNSQMMCPVHYALQHDETDLLELLIANEADLDVQDSQGMTPLILSLASNDLDSAQLLLDQCVDLQILDNAGNSALHHLLLTPKLSVHFLRTLSRKGCDFHLPNQKAVTPLDLLKLREDVNVEELLQMLDLEDC